MPKYIVNGETYGIPEWKAEAFERKYPDAKIVYNDSGNTYQLPINKREGFLRKFPNAVAEEVEQMSPIQVANSPLMSAQQPYYAPSGDYTQPTEAQRNYEQRGNFEPKGQGTVKLNGQEVPVFVGDEGQFRVPSPVKLEEQQEIFRHGYPSEEEQREELERSYRNFVQSNRAKMDETDKRLSELMGKMTHKYFNDYKGVLQSDAMGEPAYMTALKGNRDYQNLRAAHNLIEDARKREKQVRRADDGFLTNTFRSMGETAIDERTWDFGARDLTDAISLYQAVQKDERGEELTDSERILLDAFEGNALVMAQNKYRDESGGELAGAMAVEMIPFIAQIVANPLAKLGVMTGKGAAKVISNWLYRRTKDMTNKTARKAVRSAARGAVKFGTGAPADLVGGTGVALTTNVMNTAADAYQRQLKGDTEGDAWRKAILGQGIEFASENTGRFFEPFFGGVGKALGKGAGWSLGKLGAGKVVNLAKDYAKKAYSPRVKEFFDNTQWNGFFGEYGEEIAGGLMNAAMVGDQTVEQVFSKDNLFDTAVGLSVATVLFPGVASVNYAATKYNQRNDALAAEKAAKAVFGDRWETFKAAIKGAENSDELGKAIAGVYESEGKKYNSSEETKALYDYAKSYFAYNALKEVNPGSVIYRDDDYKELDDNVSVGRSLVGEELQAANLEANRLAEEVMRMTGVAADELESLSVEDVDARIDEAEANGDFEVAEVWRNFRKQEAKRWGAELTLRENIEEKSVASDAEVDAISMDGMIVPATLRGGEVVNIVGGNISVDNNGVVDEEASDKQIVIVQNGERKVVGISSIGSLGSAISAEEEKAKRRAVIEEQMRKEHRIATGQEHVFTPGETFETPNGEVQFIADRGDGTADITVNGVAGVYNVADLSDMYVAAQQMAYNAERNAENLQQTNTSASTGEGGSAENLQQGNDNKVVGEEKPSAPVDAIPMEKRGKEERAAYHMVPIARTLEDLHDGALEQQEIDGLIDARVKEAAKDLEDLQKNKPAIGADKNAYLKAKEQWQADVQNAQKVLDYYNELRAKEDEITKSEHAPITAPEDVAEIATADEYVAGLLGGIKITPESFRKETGLSTEEQKKMVGVIASEDKGGISIERASELIAENYGEELRGLGFTGDVMDIRDMLIDILSSGHPKTYAKRGKEQRVAEALEQERDAADSWARENFGFASYDDLIAYEETLIPNMIQKYAGFDEQTYFYTLAENYEYDTTRESERVGSGSEVLQGERPVSADGTESIGGRNQGGAVQYDVQGGAETTDAQETLNPSDVTAKAANEMQPIGESAVSLSETDAKGLIANMKSAAEPAYELELTPDAWDSEFGENGMLESPIGIVKMGENQYLKLLKKKRAGYFGMIKPTLTNPDVVLEEYDPKDGAERETKYLFVKTFIKADGGRYVHFESVTVQKDTLEVSISSHEVNEDALIKKMQQCKLLHLNSKFLNSEGRLIEPLKEGSDLIPTPNSTVSEGKDTTISPTTNELGEKNEKGLAKMQRQAEREGGQFLILSPNDGSAAALSALPLGLSPKGEDKNSISNSQEKRQKSGENGNTGVNEAENTEVERASQTEGETSNGSTISQEGEQVSDKDKSWSDLSAEERMNIAAKTPLTIEEIKKSSSDDVNKSNAIAYIRGTSNIITQLSYLKVYEDVRIRTTDAAQNNGGASGAQLAKADDRESANGGTGGETGNVPLSVGEESSRETASIANGGENSERESDLLSGEEGNREVLDGKSSMVGVSPTSGNSRRGGKRRSNGGDGRRRGRSDGGENTGDDAAESNAASVGSIDDEISKALDGFKSTLSDFVKAGRETLNLNLAGLNSKQLEILPKLISEGTKVGYLLVKKGVRQLGQWIQSMKSYIGAPLSDAGLSDVEVDAFIKELWNSQFPIGDEVYTIAEWASIIGMEETRKAVRTTITDKKSAQDAAETIGVKIADAENISETLPFLLPQQQDDVLKAETQFFDESHNDREHAFGKGYMFTNGTGTGKTYTGLGIVKRFIKQGKGRILIVTPSQQKVTDWISDAKNLNINLRSLEDFATQSGTTATQTAGEGAVITTYANFRENAALLEDVFDLVVYDESHRLLENKAGTETRGARQHYMVTNRDEDAAFMRLREINPIYKKISEAQEKFISIYEKEIENKSQKNIPRLHTPLSEDYKTNFPKLYKAKEAYNKAEQAWGKEELKLKEQAKKDASVTKVVFLSATPFNTRDNLDYAERYIFMYPEENKETIGSYKHQSPRTRFYLDHFGGAYKFRYGRLESAAQNADVISRQEVAFSDYLQNTLNTMSGRVIDSEFDYSRDFPTVSLEMGERINSAIGSISEVEELRPLWSARNKVWGNYNYSSALFETMKVSAMVPRLKEHLKKGRKIVIFHRRTESKEPIVPPFSLMMGFAQRELKETQNEEERKKLASAIRKFKKDYADLFEWEQTLNYAMPREQLAEAFGKENILFFSGKESTKIKNDAVKQFNDDNSGKNIIVIQEASGKEGISLHDRTGKHQRVVITLALPQSPITALQIEGRIYRIGNKSNAIFEYPILGLNSEMVLFGQNFNNSVSTTENLALGSKARNLRDSFARGIEMRSGDISVDEQGVGGKADDAGTVTENDPFDNSVLDYYTNQKITAKRDNREGVDYYPTPEPLGFMMNMWGRVKDGDEILEPSAGHGAIARYAPIENRMTAVEPSQSLFARLQIKAGGAAGRSFVNDIFENYNIINKHDVVLMNPPFGVQGKLAAEHVAKAYKHLNEGGRIVAIVPEGKAQDRIEKWLDEQKDAVVVGEVLLPDVTFVQAGTSIRCRVLVIDKISNEAKRNNAAAQKVTHNLSYVDKVEDFFEALRDIGMPDRTIDTQLIMEKKARRYASDLRSIKGVKEVYVNPDSIVVRTKGWRSFQIVWGNMTGNALRRSLAQQYSNFAKKVPYADETSQEVMMESQEIICKLANMTEDEMERFVANPMQDDDTLYRSEDAIKNRIEALFNQAISGEFKAKPISIGTLTDAGKAYLEQISGVAFKDKVDFVLNPSDLVHIYKDHFGNNEKDKGQNIPLDIEDIRSLVDVISSPDKVIFFKEGEGSNRNMFYFFKEAEDGTYNLMEIYSDRKGNLTAKTFYKTRKDATQRVMDIEKSLLPTSETYSGAILSDAKIPQMFESASVEDDFSAREGVGSYTDDELALENDPVSKVLGKPRGTRKQRNMFAQRERKRMRDAVEQVAGALYTLIVVLDSTEGLTGRRAKAKGWYEKSTGRVVVVLPNNRSVTDVMQTVLHETVAHYGLRKLFGSGFDNFIDNIYNNVDAETRRRINLLASRNGWNLKVATEEYLASLAEDANFERVNPSVWRRIKSFFLDMLAKAGIRFDIELTDDELRYILWRSYQNLKYPGKYRTIVDEARDIAKQGELKVGNYAENVSADVNVAEESDSEYDRATKVAERFNARHKGAAPVVVMKNDKPIEEQLLEIGFSQKEIDFITARYKKGANAFFNVERNIVVLLSSNLDNKQIKTILWHEAVHKVIREMGITHEQLNNFFELENEEEKVSAKEVLRNAGYEEELFAEEYLAYYIQELYWNGQLNSSDYNVLSRLNDKATENNRKQIEFVQPIINSIVNGTFGFHKQGDETGERRGAEQRSESRNNKFDGGRGTIDRLSLYNSAINEDTGAGIEDDVLFRSDSELAIENYNKRVLESSYQAQEALQDSMLALKEAQEAIVKETGKAIRDEENAYMAENALSSVNTAEAAEYKRAFYEPLVDAVSTVGKKMGYTETYDYLMAKHGIECNREMSVKEALKEKGVVDKAKYNSWKSERDNTRAEARAQGLSWEDTQRELDKLAETFGAKINDYSGLSAMFGDGFTEKAYTAVKSFEESVDTRELNARVRAASKATLMKLYNSSILDEETFSDINSMYEYYVPLRGFEEKTAEDVYAYLSQETGRVGSVMKIARGRNSKAENPIAFIGQMAEQAIAQGNRNRMKLRFLNFALSHMTSLLTVTRDVYLRRDGEDWIVVTPKEAIDKLENPTPDQIAEAVQAWEKDMNEKIKESPKAYKKVDAREQIPYKMPDKENLSEHQVYVKRAGKLFVITVNGSPRLAQALNGLTNPDQESGLIMNAINKVNRTLSKVYTTRNINFVASNIARDLVYTNSMVWVKESPEYARKFNANCAKVSIDMYSLFSKLEKGTLNMSDPTEKLFAEFIRNGGETGYTQIKDIEAKKKELKKALAKAERKGVAGFKTAPIGKTRDGLEAVDAWLDHLNRSMENIARFAAYKTSREMGRSVSKSIWDAKEISVNFNKKGAGGKFLKANGQTLLGFLAAGVSGLGRGAFVFWNAGIQGMYNIYSGAKKNPKKALGAAATLATLGVLVSLFAGDDDEYMQLPEHIRRNNLCFKFPWKDKDSWITIPLPIEYRAIYGVFEYMTNIATGKEELDGLKIAGLFTQLLPIDMLEGGGIAEGDFITPFMPSALAPFWQARENKSWTGLPIWRDSPFDPEYKPEFQRVYKGTSPYIVAFTKMLNQLGGGDDVKAGWRWLDWNPAIIEHVAEGYLGGYATMARQAMNIFSGMGYLYDSAVGNEPDENYKFDPKDIPMLSRFWKYADRERASSGMVNKFFENKKNFENTSDLLRDYSKQSFNPMVTPEEREYAMERIVEIQKSDEFKEYMIFKGFKKTLDDAYKRTKENDTPENRKMYNDLMKMVNEAIEVSVE